MSVHLDESPHSKELQSKEVDIKTQRKALEELNEVENEIEIKIENFVKLVLARNDLRCPTNPEFLIKFLRVGKFDLTKSLKRLIQYFKVKKDHAVLFIDFFPSKLIDNYKNIYQILPERDSEGRAVVIIRSENWDPKDFGAEEVLRLNILILEWLALSPKTQINGVVLIGDMNGLSMAQAKCLSYKAILMGIKILEGSFPIRYSEFHFINYSRVFNIIYALIAPFCTKKILSRIKLHKNGINSLQKSIQPLTILPESLGGKCPDLMTFQFTSDMIKHDEHFKDLSKYGFI